MRWVSRFFCEKPLGASLEDSAAMVAAAEASGVTNMVGFNYIRTPASQYARAMIEAGEIGDITWFRGEHTEDFYADPQTPGQLAHQRDGKRDDGGPCAAYGERRTRADGTDFTRHGRS